MLVDFESSSYCVVTGCYATKVSRVNVREIEFLRRKYEPTG